MVEKQEVYIFESFSRCKVMKYSCLVKVWWWSLAMLTPGGLGLNWWHLPRVRWSIESGSVHGGPPKCGTNWYRPELTGACEPMLYASIWLNLCCLSHSVTEQTWCRSHSKCIQSDRNHEMGICVWWPLNISCISLVLAFAVSTHIWQTLNKY